ncbi:hypothetical protein MSAN_01318300 [Mycena sanguinolenta]|uniref:Uncharacterized protein n=1 Tax=Mycena sanguinolenta TaxID=230812 RepID=A0A8H7D0B3_9AGAR|nr:hypothetical protein MSAN_01318300 [Mycena sanguinolenta]
MHCVSSLGSLGAASIFDNTKTHRPAAHGKWQVQWTSRASLVSHWLCLDLSGTMASSLLHQRSSRLVLAHTHPPRRLTIAAPKAVRMSERLDARAWHPTREISERHGLCMRPYSTAVIGANTGKQFVADAPKNLALHADSRRVVGSGCVTLTSASIVSALTTVS